jgi:cytochrome o ubiquinol oxidase operon protein cyoD
MSKSTHGAGLDHGSHSHEADHLGHEAHGHGSVKGYLTGFGLSVVLTAIPFWLVMSGMLSAQATGLTIMVFAVAQILVHMVFFLHMNPRSEDGWTMLALIFTIILVVIALTGSLWVMYHLNHNMMPAHEMANAP